MDEETAVQPTPDDDAASDTTLAIEDVDESYYRPGTMGSDNDDGAGRNDDESSDGFSDDISDIENNLGADRITPPGATRPILYSDGTRDDDNDERNESDPVRGDNPQNGGRNADDDNNDNATRNDQHGSHDHDNQSSDDVLPYTIADGNNDAEPGRNNQSVSIREINIYGRTVKYAVVAGYPWFYFGTREENVQHENLWRFGWIRIPGTLPPGPDVPIGYPSELWNDEAEEERFSSRCTTPYEESPYEQDDS